MARLGLERSVVDAAVFERTAAQLGRADVSLPTIAHLKLPATIPAAVEATLADVDPTSLDALNMRAVQTFWDGLLHLVPAWDEPIAEVRARSGAGQKLGLQA